MTSDMNIEQYYLNLHNILIILIILINIVLNWPLKAVTLSI